jgi:hypothetical protein
MTPREGWRASRQIRSPADLADVIRDVAEAVRVGDLKQVTLKDAPVPAVESVDQLAADGPWPDYLELHFQDTRSGRRFRLVAETYHGAGGRWEPEPSS